MCQQVVPRIPSLDFFLDIRFLFAYAVPTSQEEGMAIHLKMDFRVLELAGNLSVLQCNRGDVECLFEVEYNPRLAGSLVAAIRKLRHHACADCLKKPSQSDPGPRILTYPKTSVR